MFKCSGRCGRSQHPYRQYRTQVRRGGKAGQVSQRDPQLLTVKLFHLLQYPAQDLRAKCVQLGCIGGQHCHLSGGVLLQRHQIAVGYGFAGQSLIDCVVYDAGYGIFYLGLCQLCNCGPECGVDQNNDRHRQTDPDQHGEQNPTFWPRSGGPPPARHPQPGAYRSAHGPHLPDQPMRGPACPIRPAATLPLPAGHRPCRSHRSGRPGDRPYRAHAWGRRRTARWTPPE